jgi:hypothetical protein
MWNITFFTEITAKVNAGNTRTSAPGSYPFSGLDFPGSLLMVEIILLLSSDFIKPWFPRNGPQRMLKPVH